MSDERQETVSDIISEMRMALKPFPYVYSIGRRDAPAEFDADGLMIKPQSIVIDDVTVPVLCSRIEAAWKRERAAMLSAFKILTDQLGDYLQKGLIQLPLPMENAYAKAKVAIIRAEGGAR